MTFHLVLIFVLFYFHALLISIFVLLGDKVLAQTTALTKQSYNTFFSQFDVFLSELSSKDLINAPFLTQEY